MSYDAKSYAASRNGYPDFVYRYLEHYAPLAEKQALDLGCGTGISSRELAARGALVTGVDPNQDMLAVARRKRDGIFYHKDEAESLRFQRHSFDVVAAFSSFHNFEAMLALLAIRHVLRPSGTLFIANKFGRAFTEGYRAALTRATGIAFPPHPIFESTEWDIGALVCDFGFTQVEKQVWTYSEALTPKEALTFVQSTKYWKMLPPNMYARAAKEVGAYFDVLADPDTGLVQRTVEVFAVRAYAPST